jgi:DNA-damage-inducible protein J
MQNKQIKVQTSLRVDKQSLQEAKEILEKVGMNFSEAVNIFTKMIVYHKGLPFDVKIPSNDLTNKVKSALKEVEQIEKNSLKATNARDFINS